MLIGQELPLDPGWRIVEGDLYDISRRVQEYDPDARLVREDESGAFGLARCATNHPLLPGEVITLAARCLDYRDKQPLTGTPDARVVIHQRIADGYTIDNLNVFNRRRRDAMRAERAAIADERAEWSASHAKEYVWRRNRVDLGRKPFASIPRQV